NHENPLRGGGGSCEPPPSSGSVDLDEVVFLDLVDLVFEVTEQLRPGVGPRPLLLDELLDEALRFGQLDALLTVHEDERNPPGLHVIVHHLRRDLVESDLGQLLVDHCRKLVPSEGELLLIGHCCSSLLPSY